MSPDSPLHCFWKAHGIRVRHTGIVVRELGAPVTPIFAKVNVVRRGTNPRSVPAAALPQPLIIVS